MTKQNSRLLSPQQCDFYYAYGYLVVEDIFTQQECQKAVKIFETHATENKNILYAGIMNLDREDHRVRDLMRHDKIVTMLEELQQTQRGGVVGLQSMFLFKKAHTPYALQAWNPHQDNAYPQAPWGKYITGNIAFDDQSPENGGMYIYPGSHFEGILDFISTDSFHEKPGANPGHDVSHSLPEKYKTRKTDLYMKQGSVLFLHGNVVHGSYPNKSYLDRPMLLIPYITKGEKFIPGNTGKRMEISLRD